MRVLASVLLAVPLAFAYSVTYPGGSQGWNTTGPNYLMWERVDTDPLSFTVVLTNVNAASNQVLDAVIDGTLGITMCSPPSGGWPSGSGFRVNLAQDATHLDSLLAQSSEFNITAVSSNGSTTSSVSTLTAATTTQSTPGVSSSDTSTTPTGTSAASLGADAQASLLTAVAALTALITTLF
ncbi:hypothetical protein J3R83DRAFT_896 [Lanmaoa asiatica]|nr:hypothetical protein J3R83DRAFT_896 [Lanmaoa asiatica]